MAYHADKKDNQYLKEIVSRLHQCLWKESSVWKNIIADTDYNSGGVYAFLEQDHYLCPMGKIIPFEKVFLDYQTKIKKKEYRSSSKQCKNCPLAIQCLEKIAEEKKFSETYYREHYERNKTRVYNKKGKYMKRKRQSTVESVFGTLTQFMGLSKSTKLAK